MTSVDIAAKVVEAVQAKIDSCRETLVGLEHEHAQAIKELLGVCRTVVSVEPLSQQPKILSTSEIDALVTNNPKVSGMVADEHVKALLHELHSVLAAGVPGSIVELGCNVGTTSLYIRRLLDAMELDTPYHVYDSFQGLPDKHAKDITHSHKRQFNKGDDKVPVQKFVDNFASAKLKLPTIHVGLFSEIPDDQYPNPICFAFFDGDFYTSIMSSFGKCYAKMAKGGSICVHDFEWDVLPGVAAACHDFLRKPVPRLHPQMEIGVVRV